MGEHFVADFAIVLGVAAVTSVVFRRLGQSTVLGYLFAGLVVGPYIPIPIFADTGRIAALSEFGVALVMFAVGLEFSVRRLLRVLPLAGFAGIVQVSVLGVAGFAFARVMGLTTIDGVFLGACIAISSTMVVAKVFAERAPAPRVRALVFGILVVQDLAAVLLVAALTAVAAGAALSPDVLGTTVANLLGWLAVLVVGGLFVVPRLVRYVAKLESPEILLVTAVALCFGLGTFAEHLGYSIALGAFLAGTLVAEAGRNHDVEHLVHPVRDLFAAVFFVSIGMTVDPRLAFEHVGLALGVTAVVVLGQFVTVSTAGILTGNGVRGSVTAALALGQIGEFAFIIASIGATAGIVGDFLPPVVVTVAVLTAFTTPLLVRASGRIANAVDHALPKPLQTFASLCESWFEALRSAEPSRKSRSHLRNSAIVIAIDGLAIAAVWAVVGWWETPLRELASATLGLGPAWSRLAVVAAGVLATAPLVFAILRSARRAGQLLAERVIPAGREGEVDLGQAPRRALVMTLQLVVVLAVAMPVLVFVTPVLGTAWGLAVTGGLVVGLGVYLWRSASDLQGHVRAGAAALGELLQQQMAKETATPAVVDLLPGLGTPTAITIEAGWHAEGRSLAELDIRAATGATIVAIARDGETLPMPSGHDRLAVGDTVVLAGADHAVEAARQRLHSVS